MYKKVLISLLLIRILYKEMLISFIQGLFFQQKLVLKPRIRVTLSLPRNDSMENFYLSRSIGEVAKLGLQRLHKNCSLSAQEAILIKTLTTFGYY